MLTGPVVGSEKKNREREVVETASEMRQENETLRTRVSLLERDLTLKTKQGRGKEIEGFKRIFLPVTLEQLMVFFVFI